MHSRYISISRRIGLALAVVLSLAAYAPSATAKIEDRYFNTDAQETLYQTLVQELRCLVCQNQNLADSNAELAQDLRQKTYDMVISGKTRDDIVGYMVARYGDFVMYKPPLNTRTLVLWLGPFAFLLAGIGIAVVNLRKRSGTAELAEDESAQQQAHDILKDDN